MGPGILLDGSSLRSSRASITTTVETPTDLGGSTVAFPIWVWGDLCAASGFGWGGVRRGGGGEVVWNGGETAGEPARGGFSSPMTSKVLSNPGRHLDVWRYQVKRRWFVLCALW